MDLSYNQALNRIVINVLLSPFATLLLLKYLSSGLKCFKEERGDLDKDIIGFIYLDFNINGNGPLLSNLDKIISNFNALFNTNSNFYLLYYLYRLLLILGIDINNNFKFTKITTLSIEIKVQPIGILILAVLFMHILIYYSLTIPIIVISCNQMALIRQINCYQIVYIKKIEFNIALLLLRDYQQQKRSRVC